MGSYLDTFAFHSPKAIRRDNEVYQYIAQSPLYPKVKALDILQRNGFAGDCHDVAPTKLIPALLTDSRTETLFKGGRTADLRHFLINPHGIDQYWVTYKITLRNHYNIRHRPLVRLCGMLCRLGKDIHSPKYVCPENLQESHDTAQRKLQAQRDKEAEARRRQKAIENEECFKPSKPHSLVSPLQTELSK